MNESINVTQCLHSNSSLGRGSHCCKSIRGQREIEEKNWNTKEEEASYSYYW